jgi:hypothetical protein
MLTPRHASVRKEQEMAGQQRNMEGDSEQRRRAAREARSQGKRPSEVGATLGASKQRKETKRQASHQERLDTKRERKASFFIRSIASNARCDFSDFSSVSQLDQAVGTTCHERPYVSFSQPHCWAFGSPPADNFSQ